MLAHRHQPSVLGAMGAWLKYHWLGELTSCMPAEMEFSSFSQASVLPKMPADLGHIHRG